MTVANVVFAVMFLTAVGLAVFGALVWENVIHRQYLRGRTGGRNLGRWT